MAITGRGRTINSAWGFRQYQLVGLIELALQQPKYSLNRPTMWKDWWLEATSITNYTKSISDTLGGGGGITDIAY